MGFYCSYFCRLQIFNLYTKEDVSFNEAWLLSLKMISWLYTSTVLWPRFATTQLLVDFLQWWLIALTWSCCGTAFLWRQYRLTHEHVTLLVNINKTCQNYTAFFPAVLYRNDKSLVFQLSTLFKSHYYLIQSISTEKQTIHVPQSARGVGGNDTHNL